MLGRLARWLRVLGYDTLYDLTAPDPELVARADAEDRLLLTRDRRLLRELRPRRSLEVKGDAPLEQLRQVVEALALVPPSELFTRCLVCNELLTAVTPAEAQRLVPPQSKAAPGPVRRCAGCGRVYWQGSHVRRMRLALERALPGWLPGSGTEGGAPS